MFQYSFSIFLQPYLIPPSTFVLSSHPNQPTFTVLVTDILPSTKEYLSMLFQLAEMIFPIFDTTLTPSTCPSDFPLNVTSLEKSFLAFLLRSNALWRLSWHHAPLSFVTSVRGKIIHLFMWCFDYQLVVSTRIDAPWCQKSCLLVLTVAFPGPPGLPVLP